MKKAILILILTITYSGINAQSSTDSTQKKINYLLESNMAMQKNIQNIQLNLLQCHKVYKAGICISAIGIGMTAIGTYYNNEIPIYSGGTLILIGCGTIIYSHSYIRKASIGIGNNGLTVKYNL